MKKITLIILLLVSIVSCKKTDIKPSKKGLHLFYVILDKSSRSYSFEGGEEENYINIDTLYISELIDKAQKFANKNPTKNDVVLFFNYIDWNVQGNKELFLKIESHDVIDTVYRQNAGGVVSKKSEFKKKIEQQKQLLLESQTDFKRSKKQLLLALDQMLNKSEKTKGSDCSSALRVADSKLNSFFVDSSHYGKVKSRWIITFSDLVNFPKNNSPVKLTNRIIRPGFTSAVPYLRKEDFINMTTQQEFESYLETILKK